MELLTVDEVAEKLKVSDQTVRNLIKSGSLPAIKIGKAYRIKNTDLEEYIDSNYTGNKEETIKD